MISPKMAKDSRSGKRKRVKVAEHYYYIRMTSLTQVYSQSARVNTGIRAGESLSQLTVGRAQ
jgi:hypothetical protein